MNMKYIVIALIVGALVIGAGFLLLQPTSNTVIIEGTETTEVTTPVTTPTGTTTAVEAEERGDETIIGTTVSGRPITAYHFGEGETELLFIGGIHGGYSWNTALVAYELVDYLDENPNLIPDNVTVTVIPVLNPDGLFETVGTFGRFAPAMATGLSEEKRIAGRFNANEVDLNRNFDCEWDAEGTWQSRTVSGGSAPFSEPESAALRDFVQEYTPSAVVTWYSAAGGVYSSNCLNGVSAETKSLTALFASASGYKPYESFDFYEITGDMVNWFAKNNVPAISVLLTNHTDTEWEKNRAGIEAVISSYAE